VQQRVTSTSPPFSLVEIGWNSTKPSAASTGRAMSRILSSVA
jgi:hypothetical protein